MKRYAKQIAMFAGTAACVAMLTAFLVHDALGGSTGTIRRDALEGATFLGLALISGALLPKDRG